MRLNRPFGLQTHLPNFNGRVPRRWHRVSCSAATSLLSLPANCIRRGRDTPPVGPRSFHGAAAIAADHSRVLACHGLRSAFLPANRL